MAMHIWNGSTWKAVNRDLSSGSDRGLVVWNGSAWIDPITAKVWNGSTWKGFVDNITLSDDFVGYSSGSNSVTVEWQTNSSGFVSYSASLNGQLTQQYEWCINSSNVNQYQIRVDITAGSLDGTSSPTGSWIAAAGQAWNLTDTTGYRQCQFTAQIRNALTQEVLVTANIILEAAATP